MIEPSILPQLIIIMVSHNERGPKRSIFWNLMFQKTSIFCYSPKVYLNLEKSFMKTTPCLWFKNMLNKKLDYKNFVHDIQARSEDCVVHASRLHLSNVSGHKTHNLECVFSFTLFKYYYRFLLFMETEVTKNITIDTVVACFRWLHLLRWFSLSSKSFANFRDHRKIFLLFAMIKN
jgi:hypothetical protein